MSKSSIVPRNIQKSQSVPNFALECDRYCVSDRVAAALASSLFKDFNIVDSRGSVIVFDKNKIRREREKCRKNAKLQNVDKENVVSFSFDSKKNRTLHEERTDDNKLHPRIINQTDIAILKEPNSSFLGYAVCNDTDKSPEIVETIMQFFSEEKIDISNVIAVGCDGDLESPRIQGKIME